MGGPGNFRTITGEELRQRVDRLGLTYVEAARRLGLTEDGLYKQMRGDRRVGRQTEIILEFLEGKGRPIAKPAQVRAPYRHFLAASMCSEAPPRLKKEAPAVAKIDPWIYAWAPNASEETPRAGKWMIFPSPRNIDRYWRTIAEATEAGNLGCAAKTVAPQFRDIAAKQGQGALLLAVYTYDADDRADVERVRGRLRELGFTGHLPYKTDADTLAGKYGRARRR